MCLRENPEPPRASQRAHEPTPASSMGSSRPTPPATEACRPLRRLRAARVARVRGRASRRSVPRSAKAKELAEQVRPPGPFLLLTPRPDRLARSHANLILDGVPLVARMTSWSCRGRPATLRHEPQSRARRGG